MNEDQRRLSYRERWHEFRESDAEDTPIGLLNDAADSISRGAPRGGLEYRLAHAARSLIDALAAIRDAAAPHLDTPSAKFAAIMHVVNAMREADEQIMGAIEAAVKQEGGQ